MNKFLFNLVVDLVQAIGIIGAAVIIGDLIVWLAETSK